MRSFLACVLGAVVVACRGDAAVTATDAAMQFYTMREALGGTGAPSTKELTALRPFITDTLARALATADSLRAADMKAAPDEKPRFVEGDLFTSLFEGATSCRAMASIGSSDTTLVPLECEDNREKPAVRWIDTAVVVRSAGRWLVHDIRYGGTWDFASKGSLLASLQQSLSEKQ